ncbi:transglutaminase-like cysteine peptidase [Pseudomonas sp. 2FG]|uniref:transglutaminase-like cysteine peptidase n=1 Tax=Pseudomonas sp. 2FG TaxID=2502191 RepID=UPI0010F607CD|nr:transglutaminase-like cysteine peptidase [Pseudomonas sp. 2FG]
MAEAKASWRLERILHKAEKRYGRQSPTTDRLLSWSDLIESSQHLPEIEKLHAVNRYFNHHVRFSTDIALWKQSDYWATPIETLVKGAGDCEDFSLAKYFTLRQLGVAEEKLRIAYAKVLKSNQAHMVLTYYSTPSAEPLVLDNLINSIRPAAERRDLSLSYAFDAQGLYFVKAQGLKRIGDTEHLAYWQALLKKMRQEGFTAEQG